MYEKRDCWICFNNERNILTTIKSEKMLKSCSAYFETPIFTNSMEKDTPVVTCCIYCYESVLQLTLLEEQVQKLRNEISDLSSLFSVNIMGRRIRFAHKNDEDTDISTLTAVEFFTIQNNSDQLSDLVIENVSGTKEDMGNDFKELPSDYQRQIETDIDINLFSDSHEQENNDNDAKDNCEVANNSEGDIDVKYSYDHAVSKVVSAAGQSIAPIQSMLQVDGKADQQTYGTTMTDLLKCVKMPVVQIKRLQHCGNIDSAKIVDVAFEQTIKYEKVKNDSSKRTNASEKHSQKSQKRQKTFNKTLNAKRGVKKTIATNEMIPSGETMNKCSFCDESFKSLYHLKRHEKFHSGNRPYKCSFCPKSFYQPNHLKLHEMIHTGERPYKCSHCSKSFYKANDMKIHERMHTGERPYKCLNCDKNFVRTYQLKVHRQNIHGENGK